MDEMNFDLVSKLATSESFREYVRDLYKVYFENSPKKEKTMDKYINATKLEKEGWSASRTYPQDAHTMVYETKKLTEFPGVDVHENVKAHWKDEWFIVLHAYLPRCSSCGLHSPLRYKFCPNCGAQMEKDDGTKQD